MDSVKTSSGPSTSAIVALRDPAERARRLKTYGFARVVYVFMACIALSVAALSLFVFFAGNSPLMIAQTVTSIAFGFFFLILFLVAHIEVKMITLYMALAEQKPFSDGE